MLSGKKKDFLFSCLCKQGLISLMSYRSLLKEYSLVPNTHSIGHFTHLREG